MGPRASTEGKMHAKALWLRHVYGKEKSRPIEKTDSLSLLKVAVTQESNGN